MAQADDFRQLADRRWELSSQTVGTHRKAIMRKLGLHHKSQLMLHALQQGFVRVTPTGVYYPGFQRRIQRNVTSNNENETMALAR